MYTYKMFNVKPINHIVLWIGLENLSNWVCKIQICITTFLPAPKKMKPGFQENVSERPSCMWGIEIPGKKWIILILDSRLFFMMGLNWYLEIISSLIFDIRQDGMMVVFLDSVNMLQGVWVFGNFICQRNITEALFKALSVIIRSTYMS